MAAITAVPILGRILREFALTRDRRDRRLGRRRQRRHWLVPAGGHFGISFSQTFSPQQLGLRISGLGVLILTLWFVGRPLVAFLAARFSGHG
jgi:hypothetical protein